MSILSGVSDFFGLDIGTTAIRIVQLNGGKVKSLAKYAYTPIDPKISMSDSQADRQKLAEVIRELLGQASITVPNVAVGIPSQRVFTTVADIEKLSESETVKTIQYQADSLIPTPLAESKIDWVVLGDSPAEKDKVEVLLTSVPNDFIEGRLDLLESIGLNVLAFEPDNIAIARSIIAADAATPQMVLDIGAKTTDMVITMNGAPRLTRSIQTGSEALVRAAMQNLNIDQKQAEQFVFKFGLSKDKLEGQVHQAILGTVDLLVTDVE
jgi:type IV pilus assembly protein PilM